VKKISVITCIVSGLGLILSVIAVIMLLVNSESLFPDFSINALTTHPVVWAVISGIIFFPTLGQLLSKNKD